MAVPQSGIFAVGTPAHSYLEFDLRHNAEPVDLVPSVEALATFAPTDPDDDADEN